MITFMSISSTIAFRWMVQDPTDHRSRLVQVMAWCCQTTSHDYLIQCWIRSETTYEVTRLQRNHLLWWIYIIIFSLLHTTLLLVVIITMITCRNFMIYMQAYVYIVHYLILFFSYSLPVAILDLWLNHFWPPSYICGDITINLRH